MTVNTTIVHDYLAEHPNSTAGEVATGLGISTRLAVRALHDMLRRREAVGELPDDGGRVMYRLVERIVP